jgi:hypothetical protein
LKYYDPTTTKPIMNLAEMQHIADAAARRAKAERQGRLEAEQRAEEEWQARLEAEQQIRELEEKLRRRAS